MTFWLKNVLLAKIPISYLVKNNKPNILFGILIITHFKMSY